MSYKQMKGYKGQADYRATMSLLVPVTLIDAIKAACVSRGVVKLWAIPALIEKACGGVADAEAIGRLLDEIPDLPKVGAKARKRK